MTWTLSAASGAGTRAVSISTLWWVSSSRRQQPSPAWTKVMIWRTNRPGAGTEKRVMIAQSPWTLAAGGASVAGLPVRKVADVDGEQAAGPQRSAIAVSAWSMACSSGR